jgi:G3E family GTPase
MIFDPPTQSLAEPIALNVITGYLGAGKTTLLNRLLKAPEMADSAVIINEFGEVGIDHALVEASSEGIVELASGCLCCTVRGELVDTLLDLLARSEDGRIRRLARVVVETTGMADPAPVLHTIMGHPVLARRFRLDSVVTVVDAVNAWATLDDAEEAVKQVALADRLFLTKTDLVADPAAVETLKLRLAGLNPTARQITAADGWQVTHLIGASLWDPQTRRADIRRWLGEERRFSVVDEAHVCGPDCRHDNLVRLKRGRHDQRIRTFSLVSDRPVSVGGLDLFLDLLRSAHGPRLLRMKGIVQLVEDPDRPLVLHAVQQIMHPPARLPAWPDADRRTRIVFITRDLDEAFVRRMFATIVGDVAADTPDLAATLDNPLSINGFSGAFR